MFEPTLDELRSRRTVKWRRYGPDVLPAWVADMDFAPAPTIARALERAVARGDLGYPDVSARSGVQQSFARRVFARWAWDVDPDLVVLLPDVVRGIQNALEAFTSPGDAVAVPVPIYPPFLKVVHASRRVVVPVELAPDGSLDPELLRARVRTTRARMLLWCHPHNPTGHAYSLEELTALAHVADDTGLIVVSDEIHADLTLPGRDHIPFAALDPEIAARTVTLTSPSKAFNVAGLRLALCVSGSAPIHHQLLALPESTRSGVGSLGIEAALAAWSEDGERWLSACVHNLRERRDQLSKRLPDGIGCHPPDATYLAWLDCRVLQLPSDPAAFFLEHAKVALSPGPDFGPPGAAHARLNFATSRVLLDEILDRMLAAVAR